ncbi:hypothetical protein [Clostridium thailandense]|uniref:hypothetical protein n=1 Tax=Clostridium thailandense TaxID=2794346 RepID=UPI0039894615
MFGYTYSQSYYKKNSQEAYTIPEWIYISLKSKFPQYSELIKSENITIMKMNLKHTREFQLAVILNLQGLTGIFILYDNVNGTYEQVYEKRGLITAIQINWDTNLIITIRLGGGTGYWLDQYYAIRFTSKGWKEVWSDYAQYVKVLPEIESGVQIIGTVSFDTPDHLAYSILKRTNFTGPSQVPVNTQCSFKFYRFNYASNSFM